MSEVAIVVPSLFLMIAYLFYVVVNGFTRRQQLRAATEFQTKLLDRMGSVQELGTFLNSEGGQKFLSAGAAAEPAGGPSHQRVLRAFQVGTVMVSLGIGIFMYLGQVVPDREDYEGIGFVGTVSTAVGIGLLLSGVVSLKLSRRLGLINGHAHGSSADVARSA
jgi:TRAP-type mannitol/chloroaromatic compound transport system permease large subunit